MRAEFMEDTESADTGRVSGRPRKEKESESHRCFGSRVFIEDCGLMYMSSRIQELDKTSA